MLSNPVCVRYERKVAGKQHVLCIQFMCEITPFNGVKIKFKYKLTQWINYAEIWTYDGNCTKIFTIYSWVCSVALLLYIYCVCDERANFIECSAWHNIWFNMYHCIRIRRVLYEKQKWEKSRLFHFTRNCGPGPNVGR